MKLFLILLLALPLSSAQSEILEGKIHSIIKGSGDDDHLIRMASGRVVFLGSKDSALLTALRSERNVELLTDAGNRLHAVRSMEKGSLIFEEDPSPVVQSYRPTILRDPEAVDEVFHRLNNTYQRESQCFNRAHVWANDEYKNHHILSEKVFVFFTASYIRRNRFNWWFHVALLVKFQEAEKVSERVLDYRYVDRPVSVKDWTDLFVFSSRPCLETIKFSDYDVNPQTEDCYLIKTSMYYWQPRDIAQRDATNLEKDKFASGSVQSAGREAFSF